MLSLRFLYNTPVGTLITNFSNKGENKDKVIPYSNVTTSGDADLDEYLSNIPKAQLFKGIWLQGYLVPPNILENLENFQVRSDDVFIVTYPKSGTTWTEEILSLIYNNGDVEKAEKTLLNYRVEHLEVGRVFGHLRHLKNMKSPRLMATHLPFRLLPKQLRRPKCKIIYVARNPKDNAVSYYHHHKMSTFLGNFRGSWEKFLSYYAKGHVVYGSWFDHVLSYWEFYLSHPDKVLFITFEELKIDLPGMISRISNFVGCPISSEAIQRISEHCTFERMKTNAMVNREVLPIPDLFDMTQSKFMRKGIIGDWKNYFSPDQNQSFDKLYRNRMKDSGLNLAFEPEDAFTRMKEHGRIVVVTPDLFVARKGYDLDKLEYIKSQKENKNQTELDGSRSNANLMRNRCRCFIPSFHPHFQPDILGFDVF
ncbi:sulfotransferase family cytosolic 1B member 1-like [Centruroides sculpturatus]|uniref:sulfotransferase family cytosolic 1B member 1-like n=1 Tax=Centruroides sculpturatus TaxID=218467 RepID=UPI000C6E24DD|nr:sulfotransferase family cytosolic 1B member 1-like [Centruroides sculpturatus]